MSSDVRESREFAKQRKQERKALAKQKAEAPPAAPQPKEGRSRSPRVDTPDVQLSKALAYILRHGAAKEFLPVRADGYIRVDLVLARPRVQKIDMDGDGRSPTFGDIERVTSANDKKRYELTTGSAESPTDAGDVYWVSATQGHSIAEVKELEQTTITPENIGSLLRTTGDPPVYFAVHGTEPEAYAQIVASGGLRTMGRNHIHLALDRLGEGVISGMRRTSTRFIYVDVGKAVRDGVPFLLSSNGVVLTPGVDDTQTLPLTYVLRTEDRNGQVV